MNLSVLSFFMQLLTLLHMDLYVYLDSYKLYVLKVPTSLDLM